MALRSYVNALKKRTEMMNGDEQKDDNGVEITKQPGYDVFHSDFFFRKTSYFTNIILSDNVVLMWLNVIA